MLKEWGEGQEVEEERVLKVNMRAKRYLQKYREGAPRTASWEFEDLENGWFGFFVHFI